MTLANWAGRGLWDSHWAARWAGRTPTAPSGWKGNGSQSGQGAIELGFPGPALGQMQGEAARRLLAGMGRGNAPIPPSDLDRLTARERQILKWLQKAGPTRRSERPAATTPCRPATPFTPSSGSWALAAGRKWACGRRGAACWTTSCSEAEGLGLKWPWRSSGWLCGRNLRYVASVVKPAATDQRGGRRRWSCRVRSGEMFFHLCGVQRLEGAGSGLLGDFLVQLREVVPGGHS